MFDLVKFELKKNGKFIFYIYCIGRVDVPGYFFSDIFFDLKIKEISRKRLGIFSLVKFRSKIKNNYCLIFCEENKILKSLLRLNLFEVPFFVDQTIDLSIGRNAVIKGYRKNRKSLELRKIKKFSYSYEVKEKITDLKNIYEKMYVPLMSKRHKSKPEKFLDFKKYFKDGCLLVFCNEVAVGFASLLKERDGLVVRRMGVLDASQELYSKGVMTAVHYFLIEHALDSKFHFLSLGYSVPFLDDGVLIYKNKWGAKLSYDSKVSTSYFGVGKISKQMSEIFYGKPLIYVNKNKLGALIFGGKRDKFNVNGVDKMIDTSYFQGIDSLSQLN
jgi:hypothetical protein